ncbi:MAG TPA: hypothetical protein VH857_11285, partial [Actinomycetes bacterium]|nr:hypothetical protein [Actinomycetes bacterium]
MHSSRSGSTEAPADAVIGRLEDDLAPAPFWGDWLDPYVRQDAAGDGRDPVWPPVGMLAQFAAGPLLAAVLAEANLTSRAACPDELVVEIAA